HLLHRKALRVKSTDFAKSGSLFQSFPRQAERRATKDGKTLLRESSQSATFSQFHPTTSHFPRSGTAPGNSGHNRNPRPVPILGKREQSLQCLRNGLLQAPYSAACGGPEGAICTSKVVYRHS